jgi:hypothetical protein
MCLSLVYCYSTQWASGTAGINDLKDLVCHLIHRVTIRPNHDGIAFFFSDLG